MVDWIFPGLEFRDPLALLVAPLAPLVFWLAWRVPGSVIISSLNLVTAAPVSGRVRWIGLPGGLMALAVVALAVALAGPRTGDETSKVRREGIAMVLVIDRSGSMDARDFVDGDYSVSRLDVLKQVITEFVKGGDIGPGRPNDLIGVVAFGTFADSVSPLTLDHDNLLTILDQLQVAREQSEAATAIGEGLGLAVERLRMLEENNPMGRIRSKVVILLSDGVNNAGDVEPMHAAELAASHNIQVYAIAAGTTGYVPIPVPTLDGKTQLMRQHMEVDEKILSAIAKRTGGRFFHAGNAEELARTYHDIDRLEKSEINEVRYVQYREHYSFFVVVAMVLMAASALLNATYLRRLP
ncbi:MAG: VWA protein [Magnetococcales bacterium]|nr:VWA protein [Magnetococcales bacterium]HIJ82736.1 VWA domain-containing protein [Magnetococcales bacterium]